MRVYITEPQEINKCAIDLLKKNSFEILQKKERAKADVLFVRTYTQITKEYLKNFPNVKFILRAGVGIDNINLDECEKNDIEVINAPGSNANAVAEFVISLIIMTLRNIPQQNSRLKKGFWRSKDLLGTELKGKTLGIIGCGAIGKLIAKKLDNWDLRQILGYDLYLDKDVLAAYNITKSSFRSLVRNSDIITLHLPLTKQTKNMITIKEFRNMKESSILINTARGGIVNEKDLVKALQNKLIKGAALDVFETEPNIRPSLLKQKNLYLTPHIAAYTFEADKEMCLVPVKRLLSKRR